jgi:flagellar protein FliS
MIHRAVHIISELRASLNFEVGGELAANLGDLYDYIMRRLLQASLDGTAEPLDEVSKLLRQIATAWRSMPIPAPGPRTSV